MDRIRRGRLIGHSYENPVEIEVDLIAGILSVCVNIKKYAMHIYARTQRTLCVTCSITMKSQAASSTALVNYSKIILLKYTTIGRLEKYFTYNTTKFKCFSVLILSSMGNPCNT